MLSEVSQAQGANALRRRPSEAPRTVWLVDAGRRAAGSGGWRRRGEGRGDSAGLERRASSADGQRGQLPDDGKALQAADLRTQKWRLLQHVCFTTMKTGHSKIDSQGKVHWYPESSIVTYKQNRNPCSL